MAGSLETIAIVDVGGTIEWRNTEIDLDDVLYVQEFPGDKDTCLLGISPHAAIHVDVPYKQMIKIRKEHKKNPGRDFSTHSLPIPD